MAFSAERIRFVTRWSMCSQVCPLHLASIISKIKIILHQIRAVDVLRPVDPIRIERTGLLQSVNEHRLIQDVTFSSAILSLE
jgi:hypothetical protein